MGSSPISQRLYGTALDGGGSSRGVWMEYRGARKNVRERRSRSERSVGSISAKSRAKPEELWISPAITQCQCRDGVRSRACACTETTLHRVYVHCSSCTCTIIQLHRRLPSMAARRALPDLTYNYQADIDLGYPRTFNLQYILDTAVVLTTHPIISFTRSNRSNSENIIGLIYLWVNYEMDYAIVGPQNSLTPAQKLLAHYEGLFKNY